MKKSMTFMNKLCWNAPRNTSKIEGSALESRNNYAKSCQNYIRNPSKIDPNGDPGGYPLPKGDPQTIGKTGNAQICLLKEGQAYLFGILDDSWNDFGTGWISEGVQKSSVFDKNQHETH